MAEPKIFPFELRLTSDQVSRFETLYNDIRSRDSTARTATVPYAGICLAPRQDADGNTTGLSVVLVGFQSNATGPDLLEMYPAAPGTSSVLGYSFTTADMALLNQSFSTGSQISFLSRIFDYDRTREFGLVFIDRETLEYFVTTNFYTGTTMPTERGITITRALVHFSTNPERSLFQFFSDNESGVYRTVKVSPYPTVTLLPTEDSRASVAYYIGPTCPPFWHTDGDDGPSAQTPRQIQINNEQEKCTMYTINRKDMIKKLVEMKYLPAEPFPLYKTRRWPLIVAALVTLAAFILSIISVSKGDVFGKFG